MDKSDLYSTYNNNNNNNNNNDSFINQNPMVPQESAPQQSAPQQSVNNSQVPYNFNVNQENRLFVKNTDPSNKNNYRFGSNFFSITSESYRQGMLNAIARLNSISQSSNAAGLGAISKTFFGKKDDSNANTSSNNEIREEKIRQALQDILNSPPGFLGAYSGAQALSSATRNYGLLSQKTLTQMGNTRRKWFGFGGKKTHRSKKSKKSRKHRKH